MRSKLPFLLVLLLCSSFAQSKKKNKTYKKQIQFSETFNNLHWRNIGPFRGGRSVTSEGVVQEPATFYMGTTGGGVWKTQDNGLHWKNTVSYTHLTLPTILLV